MNIDKTSLKRKIDQSKPNELLVLSVNSLEKDSVNTNLKRIEKFINSKDDYIIAAIRK